MNNSCNACNCVPCQCHTVCTAPVVCIPTPPIATPPTMTVAGLLKLINEKCDKDTCILLQVEIELLYMMLGLEDHKPGNKPTVPPVNKPLPGVAFQLIANMVESLKGDLKDKYPSAELLKVQLKALWDCMYNKQEHHGDWKKNFTTRSLVASDDLCATDGDDAPTSIKVITPVDVGSTVFSVVNGKKCLFMSLKDNNTNEPTEASVLKDEWLSYCDVKAVIDCVLPRELDKNGAVVKGKTMCERMTIVEDYMKSHP